MVRRAGSGLIGLWLIAGLAAPPAAAESLTITAYYPPPASAAAPEPSKPQTIAVGVPDDETAVFVDVYTELELYRFGVARSQLSIVRWRFTAWNGISPNGWWTTMSGPMPSARTKVNFLQGGQNPVGRVWAPSMERGMIYTGKSPISGSAPHLMLEVEVTW